MSIGSEDTFIFSVVLQTKILQPLLYGRGVYVTKTGKYAMVNIIAEYYTIQYSRGRDKRGDVDRYKNQDESPALNVQV